VQPVRKVALVASKDKSLVNFRGPVVSALVRAGRAVTGYAPRESASIEAQLRERGAAFTAIRLSRTGMNPASDLLGIVDRYRTFRRDRPDVVLAYTAILGSLGLG
jgi:hypothetical protein